VNGGIFMKDINFLVEETPFEEGLKEEKKSIPAVKITAVVLVIAVGIAVLLAPGIYVRILEGRASAIEKKLTDAKYNEVRAVKSELSSVTGSINNKKSIINAIDNQNVPASQILLTVRNALPSGCFLNSVNYNGKSVTIKGFAESNFIAVDYVNNLQRLKIFESGNLNMSINESESSPEFTLNYTVKSQGGAK